MTVRRRTDADKTPTQPHRLKSGTALNLFELAATAMQLARAYDRAERDGDKATTATVGLALVRLGRDVTRMASGIVGHGKRRGS